MYSKARGQERSCVNSTPQLTHVDLGPRNILIKNERIAAIVDWETFSLRCHPAFWEDMGTKNEAMPAGVRQAVDEEFWENVGRSSHLHSRPYVTSRFMQCWP